LPGSASDFEDSGRGFRRPLIHRKAAAERSAMRPALPFQGIPPTRKQAAVPLDTFDRDLFCFRTAAAILRHA
jgi:hypothetical protein